MLALVLGGSGFIGSHLVDALYSAGHRVRVFDRDSSSCHAKCDKVEYHHGYFGDTAQLAEALQDVDVVFHLVSTSLPSTSNLDPVADINGNLIATVQLLQQMVKLGVKRIVYMSSGGTVYGNPHVACVPEDHPLNPICSYGVVKVAIEKYLFMFRHLHGIESIILRASNPYGPCQGHMGVQGVIPTFLNRLKNGDRIQVWGDGSITRDYIYITDLVSLCLMAGFGDAVGIYNAGSGVGHSINELLDIIREVSGVDIDVDYKQSRAFDVKKITLDISKAESDFNWRPIVDINTGVRKHWNWLLTQSH